jgi:hypothetical protein
LIQFPLLYSSPTAKGDAALFSLLLRLARAAAGVECGFEAEALGDAVLPLLAAEWAAAADGCAHGVVRLKGDRHIFAPKTPQK